MKKNIVGGREKRDKTIRSRRRRYILSLLFAGVALSLSTFSPRRKRLVLGELKGEFKNVDRQYLYRVLHEFKYDRLIDWKERDGGAVRIELTEKGRRRALEYNLEEMHINEPSHWDGIWRLVFFDVPEKHKRAREALRKQLRRLGFYEVQKSVYVFPYECRDEIDFVVEFFNVRRYVRYAEMMSPTNEEELKLYFEIE